jgi:putative ABC transport system ATP-binding protein
MAGDLAIDIRNVSKAYGRGAGRTQVLKGVSFQVARGEFVALVGQSGSGKSTLLNIIGALDLPDSGAVHILGHDYGTTSDRGLARVRNTEIGFVFQSFNLLEHLTCLGNVMLPAQFDGKMTAHQAEERALEALRRVGLADYAARRPSELSGGQKQRVAIARALFNQPALLLCDEPTGNLDSETGRDVIEFFRKINDEDGTTLLIVTHEERVSRVAKRITRILDGLIVEGDDSTIARDSEAKDSKAKDGNAKDSKEEEGAA